MIKFVCFFMLKNVACETFCKALQSKTSWVTARHISWEKIIMVLPVSIRSRECLILIIFSVGFPTLDSFLDFNFVITAIIRGHLRWGAALLTPILLNLLCTGLVWRKMETKEERNRTWVLVVTMLWPQYRALRLWWRIVVEGREEGLVEKQVYERRVKDLEPLGEAIPQVRLAWTFWIMCQTFICRCL